MQDKTQIKIDTYNKNARSFASKFMDYAPYAKHVSEFATYLEDSSKILDIGCGPGNVAKQLSSIKDLKITGIDLSSEMLATAKNNVPKGIFYLQDSRNAVFPAESFDGIILSFSIVHLYDTEAYELLENAILWLRKGGYLYVSFMEGKLPGFEATSFSPHPIYFNYFKGSEIEGFLKDKGIDCFRVVRQDYLELDGSNTTDVFLFGKKL